MIRKISRSRKKYTRPILVESIVVLHEDNLLVGSVRGNIQAAPDAELKDLDYFEIS